MRDLIPVDLLQTFVTVVDAGSFTGAARSLEVRQRGTLRGTESPSVSTLDDIHEFFAELVAAQFARRVPFQPELLAQFE